MIALLSDMHEARDTLSRVLPEYLAALRRWTSLTEAATKKTIALADGMIARYDLASMNEEQIRHIAEVTDVDYDAKGAWTALAETCERYYDARADLSVTTSRAVAYLQYVEDMEHINKTDNEVEMMFATMLAASEKHGIA